MLNDRIAIVTGGLQGIGLAIAEEFSRHGARVAAGSRRGDDTDASASALKAVGDQGMVVALDVGRSDSVNLFIECVRTKLGTPDMKSRGRGRIINIASTAARVAEATHPAYCASKAELVGLTRAVAKEGGPHAVTCVAISPGWVETEMLRNSASTIAAKTGRSQAEEIAIMGQSNPQNRLFQSGEIAALAAYCCSDAAAGLTMEDIQVNAVAFW